MSQRLRQQKNGEISLIGTERERQQENGYILDIENQYGSQDDGVNCINKILDRNKAELTSMFKENWPAIFLLLRVMAVLFVDSLFLYFPVIGKNRTCLKFDIRLTVIALCLRTVFDMIYVGKIILGYIRRRHDREPRQKTTKMYLRLYFAALDILALLPIPQVLIPIIFTRSRFLNTLELQNVFIILHALQHAPRVLRLHQSWREYTKTKLPNRSRKLWIKVAFNIFLYILTSHVVGGLWYFFSIQREMFCWHQACKKHHGCKSSSLICRFNEKNDILIEDVCPIQTPNTKVMDFGIFLEALQSSTVSSTNFPQKIMHCFSWGLRNLSSYGSNLQTSNYIWENCFAVFISIFGLMIFLLFIGNAQTYMQKATERATEKATEKAAEKATEKATEKLLEEIECKMGLIITKIESSEKASKKLLEEIEQKMGLIKPKIEPWMATNQLPDDMKEPIMTYIRRGLEENKDFDMENPISYIFKDADLMTKIKHHLCLHASLKKVQILNNKNEDLLQLICKSLKPLYYNENSYIFREGEPLNAMIFITQGSLWCFKTNNGENGEGTTSSPQCIEKGEFYGEELLEWGFNGSPSPKLSNLPISKTVITLTKVEAFALTANDWKILVSTEKEAQNSP